MGMKIRVSCDEAYLTRKQRELAAISGKPCARPASAQSALHLKLKAAADRKAQFFAHNQDLTETNWDDEPQGSDKLTFNFDYQRAGLKVEGTEVYPADVAGPALVTYFTNGGMAGLAATFTALNSLGLTKVSLPPGCYSETPELLEFLRLTGLQNGGASEEVCVVDSAAPSLAGWEQKAARAKVLVVDTSCYVSSSGRLREWIRLAREGRQSLVLVRSHTKLDNLGVEYGRLGSIVVIHSEIDGLLTALDDAVRLLGAAPAPVQFPEYADKQEFQRLCRQRVHQMIRVTRTLRSELSAAGYAPAYYQHGLFTTVAVGDGTQQGVEETAREIAAQLRERGLSVRHAGSFGFDFVGLEWFNDTRVERVMLRISGGDIPVEEARMIAKELAAELRRH